MTRTRNRQPLIWFKIICNMSASTQNGFLDSEETIDLFLHAFFHHTLPKAQWTHAAHVTLAASLLHPRNAPRCCPRCETQSGATTRRLAPEYRYLGLPRDPDSLLVKSCRADGLTSCPHPRALKQFVRWSTRSVTSVRSISSTIPTTSLRTPPRGAHGSSRTCSPFHRTESDAKAHRPASDKLDGGLTRSRHWLSVSERSTLGRDGFRDDV